MYKTKEHNYDPLAKIVQEKVVNSNGEKITEVIELEAKWLPWRRCYCSTGGIGEDGGQNTVGNCDQHRQSQNRCFGSCGRTGFTDQSCSGDSCPGC